MNHSIITQYQDDYQNLSPSKMVSQHMNSKSPEKTDEIYLNKLELKAKQLKNIIRKNKPLIEQLKAQRKFLKKICDKQKHKIDTAKVELIKGEYQSEIQALRQQRHKLQDLISVIHEQSSLKAKDFVEAKQQIHLSFIELSGALEQTQSQNKTYQKMLDYKTEAIELKRGQIAEILRQINEKSSIQRKYKQVICEIQEIQ